MNKCSQEIESTSSFASAGGPLATGNPAEAQPISHRPWLYRVGPNGTSIGSWALGAEPVVVGRGECANAGVDDRALSRSHFMLSQEGANYVLVDLESQNGTRVGGRQVKGCKLNPGDVIEAGTSVFYFAGKQLAPAEEGFVLRLAAMCEGLRKQLGPEYGQSPDRESV